MPLELVAPKSEPCKAAFVPVYITLTTGRPEVSSLHATRRPSVRLLPPRGHVLGARALPCAASRCTPSGILSRHCWQRWHAPPAAGARARQDDARTGGGGAKGPRPCPHTLLEQCAPAEWIAKGHLSAAPAALLLLGTGCPEHTRTRRSPNTSQALCRSTGSRPRARAPPRAAPPCIRKTLDRGFPAAAHPLRAARAPRSEPRRQPPQRHRPQTLGGACGARGDDHPPTRREPPCAGLHTVRGARAPRTPAVRDAAPRTACRPDTSVHRHRGERRSLQGISGPRAKDIRPAEKPPFRKRASPTFSHFWRGRGDHARGENLCLEVVARKRGRWSTADHVQQRGAGAETAWQARGCGAQDGRACPRASPRAGRPSGGGRGAQGPAPKF